MNASLNTYLNKKYDQLTNDLNTKITESEKKIKDSIILEIDGKLSAQNSKINNLITRPKSDTTKNIPDSPDKTTEYLVSRVDMIENRIKLLGDQTQNLKNLSGNIKLQIKGFAEIRENFESRINNRCDTISEEIKKFQESPEFEKIIENVVQKFLDSKK